MYSLGRRDLRVSNSPVSSRCGTDFPDMSASHCLATSERWWRQWGSEHPAALLWSSVAIFKLSSPSSLLGAHCRHYHAEVARQCEADMSRKSVPDQEETGELETRRPASYRLYIKPVFLYLPPPPLVWPELSEVFFCVFFNVFITFGRQWNRF